MSQKPSERPIWFWPLVGVLAPIGVGGFFLLVQWIQWESGNQKERLARERAEQASKIPSQPLKENTDDCSLAKKGTKKYGECICDVGKKMALDSLSETGYSLFGKEKSVERRDTWYASARKYCPTKEAEDLREKLDQLTKLRGGQGFSKVDADFAFTKDQEERLNSDGNSVESQPEEVKATSADNLNTHVGDNLNAADNLFKEGMDGCPSVSIAIMVANSPQIYGPTSESQKAELRTYAQRCGLRF